jgi:hypothetical protein
VCTPVRTGTREVVYIASVLRAMPMEINGVIYALVEKDRVVALQKSGRRLTVDSQCSVRTSTQHVSPDARELLPVRIGLL